MQDQPRIRTTHVGSLVRPPALREVLERRRDRGVVDQAELDRVTRAAVIDVVRQQAEVGIDVVSDGEFGKSISWSAYVNERLSGIEHRLDEARATAPPTSTDVELFPEFWAEYHDTQNLEVDDITGWACTGEIAYSGQAQVQRDIENLTNAIAACDTSVEGFLPVVAPGSVFGIRWDSGPYTSEREFLFAVADALREEYRSILDAGLYLQVDDAFLPYMYDIMVPPAPLEEYRAWAQLRVDALNHALRDLPTERIRYHICWGSFNAPHVGDVPAREIIDLILQVRTGHLLIEMANPRHEHEWRLWEDVELPEGRILVPGVISHATNVVEHPELVAERLVRLARLVGRDRIMGGTDCGFAQGPFTARVHPSIQWAKLRALAEGAQLASRELRDIPISA